MREVAITRRPRFCLCILRQHWNRKGLALHRTFLSFIDENFGFLKGIANAGFELVKQSSLKSFAEIGVINNLA